MFSAIFFVFLLISCSDKPLIRNFDSKEWIGDAGACKGIRKNLVERIMSAKTSFLGKAEERIRNTLGKPDRVELYERSQKFYVYYLEPGPGCTIHENNPQMLMIRFSAVGLSDEIFTQRGFSAR